MNAHTFEVELDHGKIRALNGAELPATGRAFLTLTPRAKTGAEIAASLRSMKKLSAEEATSFIKDLKEIRESAGPATSAWD